MNDTGTIMAGKTGSGIEMTCTDGCNTPPFLRGTAQGGRTAWEFWPEAGVQSKCPEDKGWRPVQPVVSPDARRIDFWYVLRVSGDCSKFLEGAPAKYSLTRE